ncbi:sugar-binding protein [Streptomyces sp. NBC_01381]|uniref:SpvB/TcaC N-terminal domain-containing protein n=1 Tax=Streptomyces sp. NBC_01381 TaxID=2903845 RepID=UPI00225AE54D|nr:SpvB/TcaC N-terminal domain-containing protein [Streptomyces sp. NBC_01381]MCX4672356.1 sugar-binding protein [Streptomyces sp. NBC_01381]
MSAAERTGSVAPPAISLPHGGGAIRGIDEKFTAAPATGTGSLTVPLALSPGRSGASPRLALTYNSGSGQGDWGQGWALPLAAVTRRTDRGLPRYQDVHPESDDFLFLGEELVPELRQAGDAWAHPAQDRGAWRVERYRPRIEAAYTRIERWTDRVSGIAHWRTLDRDNVTTLYGASPESRVVDPADARRIFSWLVCESRDDKGNAVLYRYVADDDADVDLGQTHERGHRARGTQRHIKRVLYGNRTPYAAGERLRDRTDWMFEAVFDYGEHDADVPAPSAAPGRTWTCRHDPFSTYRAGFEVRSYRLCRRVLMFHHFPDDPAVGRNCLVRSTDFGYRGDPARGEPRGSLLSSVVVSGYTRQAVGYRKKSLPPLELAYSEAELSEELRTLDPDSATHLPIGATQWADLYGDGLAGAWIDVPDGWLYKPNLGPLTGDGTARLGPAVPVPTRPTTGRVGRLADLTGEGRLHLVDFTRPVAGSHARTRVDGWSRFTPFTNLPDLNWDDPQLRLLDVTGDGRADAVLTAEHALTYYPSLGAAGFGPARRMPQARDEDTGPRLLFDDGTQSVFTADMCGDGLAALVRVRNGEICYWPNVGGRFGAKVTMDAAPWFDRAELFDPRRIRFLDSDGNGCADVCYLGRDTVRLWLNRSGNRWDPPRVLHALPRGTGAADVTVTDLLGNGTACLVLTSPLPGDARTPVRYVDLMGGIKPRLLTEIRNNLGAETVITYAPSTAYALADRMKGQPWATRLPFPVHVVAAVRTRDRISGNLFTTRYSYRHGHYEDREFRGFGRVDQLDTEEYEVLRGTGPVPPANVDKASHVPPALTRTWYHTGAYTEGGRISRAYEDEYYREPGPTAGDLLLPDTVLPASVRGTADEREACRALKGSILRQEVYGLDATPDVPYTVSERNYTIEPLQPRTAGYRHAVMAVHARETVDFHYERRPDPRVSHSLTLETDAYGNVLAAAAIAYGRRGVDVSLPEEDRARQRRSHVTYTETRHTLPVEEPDAYRAPLPCDAHTFELLGAVQGSGLLSFETVEARAAEAAAAPDVPYENERGTGVPVGAARRRRIEHVRTLFRREDLDDVQGSLPLGQLGRRALPYETAKLALTPGLIAQEYRRDGEDLLPAAARATMLGTEGGYTHDADEWWLPSGRMHYSHDPADAPAAELASAQRHFFLPVRHRDPFGHDSLITYDDDILLVRRTQDPVGNVVTAEHDHRVLQPRLVTDANGNRTQVLFDTLGLVTATAVMGKATETLGDSTSGLTADLSEQQTADYLSDPLTAPHTLLGRATTRLVYDLFAYARTREAAHPDPPVVATLTRETHAADLGPGETTRVQHRLVYSDGFGREIQTKATAESDAAGAPRWVRSGWAVFNNKGSTVRRHEPDFTPTPAFEFDQRVGVATTLLYDPLQRVAATVHPDHTYEKAVFDAWQQTTWDVNDTVLRVDPRFDPDVGALIARIPREDILPTWYVQRSGGALGAREQSAATKAAAHDSTPTRVDLDALGRAFRTVTRSAKNTAHIERRRLDIEGNVREVQDARGRLVMVGAYDLLGRCIRTVSMEAGGRWLLPDTAGGPLYGWDSRGHQVRTVHDAARRPAETWLRNASAPETLTDRTLYGESQGAALNLRGKPWRTYDQAGRVTHTRYDFKGNLLESRRALAAEYRATVDWSASPPLEPEFAPATTVYDALNRPASLTTPDGSTTVPAYNEAGLLESVSVSVRGAPASLFISDIDYNAKGQRTLIAYGNGASTDYTYDPRTFRLRRLHTVRGGTAYQDLGYTYDPAGNITAIQDDAQQTVFFRNVRVEPAADFTYDALYRLTEATGREHLGLLAAGVHAPVVDHPGDRDALGRYHESYAYDLAGNLDLLTHTGTDPAHPGWTRRFGYEERSALDAAQHSNRLSWTGFAGTPTTEPYAHDAHGNMTAMPHLSLMTWDHRDQLRSMATTVPAQSAAVTYYVYDGAGARVRKVTDGPSGKRMRDRVYLGGVELYRAYDTDGTTVNLRRETLHVMDDTRRIALVDSRTEGDDGSPELLVRYQFGDHLDSAALELGAAGQVISYEEYHPYGTTAHRASRSRTDPPKRYGFTGKERDEESRLSWYGARYYAPWLARWTSTDPSGIAGDGPQLYGFCRQSPVTRFDPDGSASKIAEVDVVNLATDFLDKHNIPYAREVDYIVKGGKPGRHDLVIGKGGTLQIEAKIYSSSPYTEAQKVNHPLIRLGGEQTVTRSAPEISVKAGTVVQNDLFDLTHANVNDEFANVVRKKFPEKFDTPVKAVPPTVRRVGPDGKKTTLGPLKATPVAEGVAAPAGTPPAGPVVAPVVEVAPPVGGGPPAENAPTGGRVSPGVGPVVRGLGRDLLAAGKFGLGVGGLVLGATASTPHHWESYYDTGDAELVYALGSALHLLGIGKGAHKPPHMGGDPVEYFRGTRFDGVNWPEVYQNWAGRNSSSDPSGK